jgi:hypothetical protein
MEVPELELVQMPELVLALVLLQVWVQLWVWSQAKVLVQVWVEVHMLVPMFFLLQQLWY